MFQHRLRVALSLFLVTACAGPEVDESTFPAQPELAALLAEGSLEVPRIGVYGRQVSGASPEAQAWFDQGVRYSYGFNQDQAGACYARAALASPECPMA